LDRDSCQSAINSLSEQREALRNIAKKMIEERGSKKPTPIDEYIGIAVRSHRKELGLSQIALAKAIGVTFQQVQKYEKGANRIGAGRLSAIAKALQVPVTSFFAPASGLQRDRLPSSGNAMDFLRLPGATDLLGYYTQIKDPARRKTVLKLARALAAGV
jgi:transcriptional regulator with XRE-family HTH domain